MILKFLEKDYKLALHRAETQGLLKNNSCGIQGVINGHIGEICFFKYFNKNYNIQHINDKDYDFLLENFKIEIKTKQVNSLKLKSFYTNRVSSQNPNQYCDYYVFLRLKYLTCRTGFIKFCGFISRKLFLNQSFYKSNYFHIPISKCYGLNNFLMLLNSKTSKFPVTTNVSVKQLLYILFLK